MIKEILGPLSLGKCAPLPPKFCPAHTTNVLEFKDHNKEIERQLLASILLTQTHQNPPTSNHSQFHPLPHKTFPLSRARRATA